MVYNLSNPLEKQQFLTRTAYLAERGGTVELTSRKPRSLNQNSYLHSILGYFAIHYGESLEYVKQRVFKEYVNLDTFAVWRENELRGKYKSWRSTSSLTTEEMSLCIDRFRDYSAKEFGLYLPTSDDYDAMRQIDIEIQRNKQFI